MRKELILSIIVLAIILSGCQPTTKITGGFVGGTEGVTIKFLTDTPPVEVYDASQYPFEVAVQLQNKGESTVEVNNLKVELSGVSKQDFGGEYKHFNDGNGRAGKLIKTYRDSTGSVVPGTTDYIYFRDFMYKPTVKGSAITFTLRADLCYHYWTTAVTKLCIKKQFTAPGEEQVCNVNEAKPIDVSSAPVQLTSFKEMPGGPNRIAFSFEIQHKGSGAVYKHMFKYPGDREALCLGTITDVSEKLKQQNKVNVKVETGIGSGPVCSGLTAAGADQDNWGDVHLHDGKRIITCTQDIAAEEHAYEKPVTITLEYDYKQHIETPITVKHVGGVE